MQHGSQQGFCKIRATEYSLKDIGKSNRLLYLGRSKNKVTAKQAAVILLPVLRKAPNVGCHVRRTLCYGKRRLTKQNIFAAITI